MFSIVGVKLVSRVVGRALARLRGKLASYESKVCRRRFNAKQLAAILHRVLEPES